MSRLILIEPGYADPSRETREQPTGKERIGAPILAGPRYSAE